MSLVKVSGNASGTGTLTIAAPNTNSDYTLTLPTGTGTFNISGVVNEVPAGTASAPSIYPTGDTNTGIFFPAADTIAFTEGGAEAMRIDSSANLQFNSGYGSVATAYACRAWVNFNGTGTVAIRGSANVTSITDSGVGLYDVNFTTAMPDVNYAVAVTAYSTNSSIYAIGGQTNGQAPTTAKFRIATGAGASLGADTTAGYADLPYIFASVFR